MIWHESVKGQQRKGVKGTNLFSKSGGQKINLSPLTESESGIKFSGAVRISDASIESVVKILLNERCSYIVFSPEDVIVGNIINAEWSGGVSQDIKLIYSVSVVKGVFLDLVGEFDDFEKGFSIFGRRDVVNRFS